MIEGLEVRELNGRRLELPHLSLNIEITELFSKRVQLRSFKMYDGFLEILQDETTPLRLAGLPEQQQSQEPQNREARWQFGVDDLIIKNTQARLYGLHSQEIFVLDTVKLKNIIPWQADIPAEIDASLGLRDGTVKISGTGFLFTKAPSVTAKLNSKSLDFARLLKLFSKTEPASIVGLVSGDLNVQATIDGKQKSSAQTETSLSLAGTLQVDGLKIDDTSSELTAHRVAVSNLSSTFKRSHAGKVHVVAAARVGVSKLDVTTTQAQLHNEEIRWEGDLNAIIDPAGKLTARVMGKLNSQLLALTLPASALKVAQESARWNGQIDIRQESASAEPTIDLNGSAESHNIQVDSPKLGVRLMRLGSLRLDGTQTKGVDDIRVRHVTAQNLETIQRITPNTKKGSGKKPYVAFRGGLVGKELSIKNGAEIRLDQLLLDGADLQIERLDNGELRLVGSLLKQIARLNAAAEKGAHRTSKALSVRIKKWTVTGNSRLALADRSVKPAATFVISPVQIDIKNIDTDEPNKNVPIEINAKLGKYAVLDFKGTFRPFSPRLNLDVAGKLTGFELTSVSGYARRYMGYDLTQGRLDTKIHARIIDGKLQTDSALTISKLKVKTVDPEVLKPLENRLEIPLETGLALLRDSEDVIHLSVPVTGDITNPEFDFSDAINSSIGNAIKKTILTTLKVAFPLGGIIMAVAESGGKATLQLNPLPFVTGSTDLNAASKASLIKVAELLKSRPTLKVSICGLAVLKDMANTDAAEKSSQDQLPEATTTTLLKLGKQRAAAVKDHLIKRHNIAEPRLFLCAPKVNKKIDAIPRVEIRL